MGSDKVVGEETGRDVGVLERCRVELGHQLELAVGDGEVGATLFIAKKKHDVNAQFNSYGLTLGVPDTPGRRDEPRRPRTYPKLRPG